jgi:hypothetical protein
VIPPGFLQELLERVDIVDVVGQHVELKRGGTSWMGLCPFHAEKSPSFSVVPAKQFYYCFGCGAGGDAIRFLTEHLGLSFVEAVRDLAGRAGMTVPEEQVSPEERERSDTLRQRRLSLHEVLDRAAAFYRQQLKASPAAIAYLKQRGLSGTIAARFGLGYAPPGWKTLAGVVPRYDDPLLEEAGLVRQREAEGDGHPGYDDTPARDAAAAAGANLFLTKPHSYLKLAAQIQRLVREYHCHDSQPEQLRQLHHNLSYLEQQAAGYGPLAVPLELHNQIDANRRQIEAIENGDTPQ